LNAGNFFISSNKKRARDSFGVLGVQTYDISALFAEAELPSGILNNLKMPLFLWALFLRIVWYFGYSKKCESFRDFKKRIKNANTYIKGTLEHNDNVVIMAHGFVNLLLEKELLKDRWVKVECKKRNEFLSYKKFSMSTWGQ
jgi:broad specificity phosphatase PhoE